MSVPGNMYVAAGVFLWYCDLIWILGLFGIFEVVGGGGGVDLVEVA